MTRHDRISTPFDRDSTAFEVIAGVDLSGKRAIVTGGSSGIGVETARALASAGAQVTLAVRNTKPASEQRPTSPRPRAILKCSSSVWS
jgi:NADPH-dependent 2,4-dienoyl-CoA reductase/sulfur reductase-like enzyme